ADANGTCSSRLTNLVQIRGYHLQHGLVHWLPPIDTIRVDGIEGLVWTQHTSKLRPYVKGEATVTMHEEQRGPAAGFLEWQEHRSGATSRHQVIDSWSQPFDGR